ncbi:hypothetical protein F4821DRAFT_252774 [Hypoxylon rubiginosum]|uniref:Uncharacterized protein n=1 Tax=Hypoxylon rubiginosum TaxID=110542 RepID=A0ACC0DNR9_9PEZI|nr:hypothetical protein F4821DRAFT_252774 [Hypoxylon rubiginosum]
MSDETVAQPAAAQPSEATAGAAKPDSVAPTTDAKSIGVDAPAADADHGKENGATENIADSEDTTTVTAADAAAASTNEKPADTEDVEMADKPADEPLVDPKDDTEKADAEQETTVAATAETESATPGDKSKGQARRKSAGDAKTKKLNKKASKAKILHVDAKPGEHFFAKLKGFPPWPVIIAEEDMLPSSMLNTRPVTAARPDGTYREDIADGGKRIQDRTFPVMYLHTNEFSWTTNTDLSELDPSTVAGMVTTKMRKDLQNAHLLAAEQNSLDYYKNVLREFEEQRLAKIEAKKAKGTKTPKKAKAAEPEPADEDEDVEMADAEEGVEAEPAEKKPKSKKRKAEDDANTPQRSESVKKPKIKLTNSSTPKASNGVQSPAPRESAKPMKVKAKASKAGKEKAETKKEKEKEKETPAPKEPELSPEEKHVRKEKEILFLRHRLQKGLLLRDQEPKEEEMKSMSEFLAKLETFPDLEVKIIKATKINKVLKAILKLDAIPNEDEFQLKPRSQTLLDKWNKLLATAEAAASGSASATNGVNGGKSATNGVKETSTDPKVEPEEDSKGDAPEKDSKDEADTKATTDEEKPDASEAANTSTGEAAAEVESTA